MQEQEFLKGFSKQTKKTPLIKKLQKNQKTNKKKQVNQIEIPKTIDLEYELKRVNYHDRFKKVIKGMIVVLVIVAAFSTIIAMLVMPVLKIYGISMQPTLNEGQMVIAIKNTSIKRGDIIAFYYNNKILVKRVVALPYEWVNIDEDGNVYINSELLQENYISEKAYGEVDIEFPYQVPEESYFVLGDNRKVSIDSRSSVVSSASKDNVIGKIIFRFWPFDKLKFIK